MPFDTTTMSPTERLKNHASLTPRERLIALRDLLREGLPEGFYWHYDFIGGAYTMLNDYERMCVREENHCGSAGCAIGLYAVVTRDVPIQRPNETFGLSDDQIDRIFYGYHDLYLERYGHDFMEDAKPHDVADVIDLVLEEEKS